LVNGEAKNQRNDKKGQGEVTHQKKQMSPTTTTVSAKKGPSVGAQKNFKKEDLGS